MSDIRTRPATKEYRDNFPFPEKKRKQYKPDMGEAEAKATHKYVAKKTAEKKMGRKDAGKS